jgi:hypothetical protein
LREDTDGHTGDLGDRVVVDHRDGVGLAEGDETAFPGDVIPILEL